MITDDYLLSLPVEAETPILTAVLLDAMGEPASDDAGGES